MSDITSCAVEPRLVVEITGDIPPAVWAPLFVTGVLLPLPRPMSVARWLVQELGLEPEYVAREIGAAFLDGRPLDDFEAAMLHPGATLAVGAAVPGLVGISLNRGSPLACFRHDISQGSAAEGHAEQGAGEVRLKLFNFPARALGARLAARGAGVTVAQFAGWCSDHAEALAAGGVRFRRDGREGADFDAVAQGLSADAVVVVRAAGA